MTAAISTMSAAGTAHWLLAGTLVIRGLGFGATMMPATAAGYRNLPAAATGHASAVLQILSRVGGTLGAALMAVILTQRISAETAAGGPTPAALSGAYDTTFWWGTAITAAGIVFALFLPGTVLHESSADTGDDTNPPGTSFSSGGHGRHL